MTTANPSQKYPLANDADGNPLDVPPEAVAWRVRRLAARAGRPKVVFDLETGRPLELPLTVGAAELADYLTESGRYRLEAVDASGRTITGCVAVTEVQFDDEEEQRPVAMSGAEVVPYLVSLVEKVVDSNARVMEAMASAFGQVRPLRQEPITIGAASNVAAGGSGSTGGLGNLLEVLQQFGGAVTNVVNTVAAQKAMAGVAPAATPQAS